MKDKQKQSEYNKLYRLKNPEKIKQLSYDWYHKNKERMVERSNQWRLNNIEKQKQTRSLYMKTPKGKLNQTKSGAKRRKIDFLITDEEALGILSKNCFYCSENEVGIDRINSQLPYTLENSLPCCSMCNYMKNDYTFEAFISQCKKIAVKHS